MFHVFPYCILLKIVVEFKWPFLTFPCGVFLDCIIRVSLSLVNPIILHENLCITSLAI